MSDANFAIANINSNKFHCKFFLLQWAAMKLCQLFQSLGYWCLNCVGQCNRKIRHEFGRTSPVRSGGSLILGVLSVMGCPTHSTYGLTSMFNGVCPQALSHSFQDILIGKSLGQEKHTRLSSLGVHACFERVRLPQFVFSFLKLYCL